MWRIWLPRIFGLALILVLFRLPEGKFWSAMSWVIVILVIGWGWLLSELALGLLEWRKRGWEK